MRPRGRRVALAGPALRRGLPRRAGGPGRGAAGARRRGRGRSGDGGDRRPPPAAAQPARCRRGCRERGRGRESRGGARSRLAASRARPPPGWGARRRSPAAAEDARAPGRARTKRRRAPGGASGPRRRRGTARHGTARFCPAADCGHRRLLQQFDVLRRLSRLHLAARRGCQRCWGPFSRIATAASCPAPRAPRLAPCASHTARAPCPSKGQHCVWEPTMVVYSRLKTELGVAP